MMNLSKSLRILHIRKAKKKAGLPPGSLVHIGKERRDNVSVHVIRYNDQESKNIETENIPEAIRSIDNNCINWYMIDGVHDISIIKHFGDILELEPMWLEDILNTDHRPKVEFNNKNIFITLKLLSVTRKEIESEQVSLILGDGYVLSFTEKKISEFNYVRDKIINNRGQIRQRKADYLFYVLIDAIVDHYFFADEFISDKIETLEENIYSDDQDFYMNLIQSLKKDMIITRKAIYPLRDALDKLVNEDSFLIHKDNYKYISDIDDHILHLAESFDSNREVVADLENLHQSFISNKLNEVMKILTVMSSIFIPLTFITSLYGMNFKFMPELGWSYGYLMVWGYIVLISGSLLWYFKRQKWF